MQKDIKFPCFWNGGGAQERLLQIMLEVAKGCRTRIIFRQ